MSRAFAAGPVLAGLKPFQRATVDHVVRRFHGPDPTRRFLVADETGLGKSMVARGVIARTIEELQHRSDIARIDVVYVCSNADLAQQNITRLDVTGDPHLPFASRLTLLAKHARTLAAGGGRFIKPVNLVSFTPGTSFEMGWQTGKAEERAMLFLLLAPLLGLSGGPRRRAALTLLRGQVRADDRFRAVVKQLDRELGGVVDPTIASGFAQAVRGEPLCRLAAMVDATVGHDTVPVGLHQQARLLIGQLRAELARVSVETLEPDLVILDEFQRFRHLLDRGTEAGQLAHHLFDHRDARVLLLSATPYKPFTYAEEGEDDHRRDFLQTVRFLADGSAALDPDALGAELDAYRQAAVTGRPAGVLARDLRRRLLRVMCRSERPEVSAGLHEHVAPAVPQENDLLGYVALVELARAVDGQIGLDQWKSAPYFVNFCDGYDLGGKLQKALADGGGCARLRPLLDRTQHLDRDAVRRFVPVDHGNARLRRLAAETVDAGWWRLLWLPPSLPYLAPGGPYAEPGAAAITKRLVFSSWSATPTAIAALLSYEAERRLAEGTGLTENIPAARRTMPSRLAYGVEQGRPQAMTTLALFWPVPDLAALADPLRAARTGRAVPADEAERAVAARLTADLPTGPTSRAAAAEAWYWAAALRRPDALPNALAGDRDGVIGALSGVVAPAEDDPEDPRGLAAHVDLALTARRRHLALPPPPPDLAATLAELGMHAPGNVAWRALQRVAHGHPAVTPAGHWRAAALLATGLRSLFSRLDSALLLGGLMPDRPYWRAVLRYSAWGNLQAVLDEYLHHLVVAQGTSVLDDDRLVAVARDAADAMALRPSRYAAFDPFHPAEPIAFTSRFALRYGGRRQNQDDARQPEIRHAFNSPFWPFVLATTSIGQEGIDFHWWSHAVQHWNTPANPVDFEQREGRVNRYSGHAIRRNIAHHHGAAVLRSDPVDAWRTAYDLAAAAGDGDFTPHWVYPGPARIERHLAPYPLSVDGARLARLKDDLALYRLTFGQPRQEDMLELLRRRGVRAASEWADQLRIDLRPPAAGADA